MYHSTLGSRVIKNKKKSKDLVDDDVLQASDAVGARPFYYTHLDDPVDSDQ